MVVPAKNHEKERRDRGGNSWTIIGFKTFTLRSRSSPNSDDSEAVGEALRGRRNESQSDSSTSLREPL
jgi:hypothetical protein